MINMGTINSGKRLVVEPTYENVASDFASTYNAQKNCRLISGFRTMDSTACTASIKSDRPTHRRLSISEAGM